MTKVTTEFLVLMGAAVNENEKLVGMAATLMMAARAQGREFVEVPDQDAALWNQLLPKCLMSKGVAVVGPVTQVREGRLELTEMGRGLLKLAMVDESQASANA